MADIRAHLQRWPAAVFHSAGGRGGAGPGWDRARFAQRLQVALQSLAALLVLRVSL